MLETRAVLDGCLGVVQRARAADDEETVIFLSDDLDGLLTALDNRLKRCGSGREFRGEQLRGDERVIAKDWPNESAHGMFGAVKRLCSYL